MFWKCMSLTFGCVLFKTGKPPPKPENMCVVIFKLKNGSKVKSQPTLHLLQFDLPGNFIPMPNPATGNPTGALEGGCEDAVGFSEGICKSERGSVGGRTRGFLTAILAFCGEESSTDACTWNCPKKQSTLVN